MYYFKNGEVIKLNDNRKQTPKPQKAKQTLRENYTCKFGGSFLNWLLIICILILIGLIIFYVWFVKPEKVPENRPLPIKQTSSIRF